MGIVQIKNMLEDLRLSGMLKSFDALVMWLAIFY